MDPFHLVRPATDALDEVRHEVWNAARRAQYTAGARWLKGARWALWKAPERLSGRQRATLATIQRTNRRLDRAYLLKEQLRAVVCEPPAEGAIELLDAWIAWAPALAPCALRQARRHRPGRPRGDRRPSPTASRTPAWRPPAPRSAITRRAFGFHSARALIALAMLTLGGLCPPLPGRALT